MTSLFILLGVLLSSLTVYAQVKPQDGFDVEKVEGKWYDVGCASNSKAFVSNKSTFQMALHIFTFAANGDLTMKFEGLEGRDKCNKATFRGKKGSEAGVYIFEPFGYTFTITFTEVMDPDYAFVHLKLVEGSDIHIMSKLLARSQEVSDDVKNKWKEIVQSYGIKDENILFPPKKEGCQA